MLYRIISFLIIILTFVNIFHPSSVLAVTETSNLTSIDSIGCFNSNPKALNNGSPVIGTKTDCQLYINSSDTEIDKFFNSTNRVRIGSAAQSSACEKPDFSSRPFFVYCKNIPVSGRAGFQTVKIKGKIVGKIKVENSVPGLNLDKIVHIDDKKDLNDPNHSYQILLSTKNFKTGISGYKVIIYPKSLKNPLKSKIILQDNEQLNFYDIPQSVTRSQLLNSTNEVCVIVARYNRLLPKTKSCKALPANVPNKQITSEVFSKALECPEFIQVSKGETSLKCSLNMPEGSVIYDENYYGTKDKMFYNLLTEPNSGSIIGAPITAFDVEFVGQDIGRCKIDGKQFVCDIKPDQIKQNNLILPFRSVIGVQFTPFGGDMSDYKIVKSVQFR